VAQLSKETQKIVLELQQNLLVIIHESTSFQFMILENYGETEATLCDLEQLDNVQQRADTYYSRFSTLLRQIAASQPSATSATLALLSRSIEDAQGTVFALRATIQEIKQDWGLR
jgi:lantibiotic modifying enzyme